MLVNLQHSVGNTNLQRPQISKNEIFDFCVFFPFISQIFQQGQKKRSLQIHTWNTLFYIYKYFGYFCNCCLISTKIYRRCGHAKRTNKKIKMLFPIVSTMIIFLRDLHLPTLGWCNIFIIRTSRKSLFKLDWFIVFLSMTLIATSRPVSTCRASFTILGLKNTWIIINSV